MASTLPVGAGVVVIGIGSPAPIWKRALPESGYWWSATALEAQRPINAQATANDDDFERMIPPFDVVLPMLRVSALSAAV